MIILREKIHAFGEKVIVVSNLKIEGKLTEGKTKVIYEVAGDEKLVVLESKDDITAGNGAKHDVMPGKAAFANATTCNIFRLLNKSGIPIAFLKQQDGTSFIAIRCNMIPYEIVVRREAHGSYLKRYPYFKKGHVFREPVIEFFLKTKDQTWNGCHLPKDDPLIHFKEDRMFLFRPDLPMHNQRPFLELNEYPLKDKLELCGQMEKIALQTFLVIERAWSLLTLRLVDFKIEFGISQDNRLLLADVIDNDSWRLIEDEEYLDKQQYREGSSLDAVRANYERVARLSNHLE